MDLLDNKIPLDPVIERYKKDVDRTLLLENLKLSVEQRLQKAMEHQHFAKAIRQAGKKARVPK